MRISRAGLHAPSNTTAAEIKAFVKRVIIVLFALVASPPPAFAQTANLSPEQPPSASPAIATAKRLQAILLGTETPKDNQERLDLAQFAWTEKQYAAAARLLGEALRADPKLADDRSASIRYWAATAAALALSPQAKTEPPLDDTGRSALRLQAREWLREELRAWSKFSEKGKPEDQELTAQTLASWAIDDDLKTLRDPEELAKLPEAERAAFLAFWSEARDISEGAAARGAILAESPKAGASLPAVAAPPEGFEIDRSPAEPNPVFEDLTLPKDEEQVSDKNDLYILYERWQKFLKNRQFQEAISEARAMVRAEPGVPFTHRALALALDRNGQLDEAIVEIREAVRCDPNDLTVHELLGDALVRKGEFDQATIEFIEASRLNPSKAMIHKRLAYTLAKSGKSEEAIKSLREAIRLEPNDADGHARLANQLSKMGKVDEAIDENRKAIELQPDSGMAHTNLAHDLMTKGRIDEGIVEFREMVRLDPQSVQARYNLGEALRLKHYDKEALVEFREALRLSPETPTPHFGIAMALASQGQFGEAIAELRQALRIQPDFIEARVELAKVLKVNRQFDEALVEVREAIKLQPGNANAYLELGAILARLGRIDEAITESRTAVQMAPGRANAHVSLGMVLFNAKQNDEAFRELREAIRCDPNHALAHATLGLALFHSGEKTGLAEEFREAVRLQPDLGEGHLGLGLTAMIEGQNDTSLAEFREAIRCKPSLAEAHQFLGAGLGYTGHWDEGIAELREAIRYNPDYAEAHHNLAVSLLKKGRRDEAIAEIREAIRCAPGSFVYHNTLGALHAQKREFDLAIVEFREAIRYNAKFPLAYRNLTYALKSQGHFEEALDSAKKGLELDSRIPNSEGILAKLVEDCEIAVRLAPRLQAMIDGQETPKDNKERLALASIAYIKQFYVASTKFYDDALRDDPALADDPKQYVRYNASCSAAMAAAAESKDEPEPALDEKSRSAFRQHALEGLRIELRRWTAKVEAGNSNDSKTVVEKLSYLKEDPDLASIRDPEALAKLTPTERQELEAFWRDVDGLRKRLNPRVESR